MSTATNNITTQDSVTSVAVPLYMALAVEAATDFKAVVLLSSFILTWCYSAYAQPRSHIQKSQSPFGA